MPLPWQDGEARGRLHKDGDHALRLGRNRKATSRELFSALRRATPDDVRALRCAAPRAVLLLRAGWCCFSVLRRRRRAGKREREREHGFAKRTASSRQSLSRVTGYTTGAGRVDEDGASRTYGQASYHLDHHHHTPSPASSATTICIAAQGLGHVALASPVRQAVCAFCVRAALHSVVAVPHPAQRTRTHVHIVETLLSRNQNVEGAAIKRAKAHGRRTVQVPMNSAEISCYSPCIDQQQRTHAPLINASVNVGRTSLQSHISLWSGGRVPCVWHRSRPTFLCRIVSGSDWPDRDATKKQEARRGARTRCGGAAQCAFSAYRQSADR